MPRISVIIRTKNEESGLRKCLAEIRKQTVRDVEVIVVDSGSTDRTVEVAREGGCRIIQIAPDMFTFGRALNIGINEATGEIAVVISAHCAPKDEHWLEYLVGPFDDIVGLAGVYGRQIPFPDASPIEQRGLFEAFPPGDSPKVQDVGMFSNAHSAIAVNVWRSLPFNEELTGAEDIEWCLRAHQAGYRIAYEPRSAVHHSHEETLQGVYRRFYRETLALRTFPNRFVQPFGILGALLRWPKAVCLDWSFLVATSLPIKYRLEWFVLTPFFRAAVYYGQYQANRFADRKK